MMQVKGHATCAVGDGGTWTVQVKQEVQGLKTEVKGHATCASGDGATRPVQVQQV